VFYRGVAAGIAIGSRRFFGESLRIGGSALSKELEGHLWRIDGVAFEATARRRSNDNIYAHGDDGSEAYLTFENGEIGGSLGCGQLTGRYSLSDDSVQISISWTNERYSIEFRMRTNEVISALRGAVHLERGGDDAFHLFDEQKTYFIRFELLSPGFDLSEFRRTFWQLVSLEGNPITESDAEVRLDREAIEISMSKFRAQYAFHYRSRKFLSHGPWSTTRPGGLDLPPLFKTFEEVLHRIATYRANGDELMVLDASGQQIMLLRRIPPAGLEYRDWLIVQYGMDGWLNPTIRPLQVMTFVRGELRAAAGCRGWSGTYNSRATAYLPVQAP
jgi:hypothetical protein